MARNKAFTLLEVMIAIALIAIASTAISFRMRSSVERKKFHSDLDRLKTRMHVLQKLAIASQADWACILKKDPTGWTFSVQCDEPNGQQFSPLHIAPMDLFLNGKKISHQLLFDFFASGHTSPNGLFSFKRGSCEERWSGVDLFQRTEGNKLGPKHPDRESIR